MPYTAIAFDLDGVLIQSVPLNREAREHVLKKHFGIILDEEDKVMLTGVTDNFGFAYMAEKYQQPEILVQLALLKEEKTSHFLTIAKDRLALFPGAIETLIYAKAHFRTALTTSTEPVQLDFVMEKFGLQAYFDVVVTSKDVQKGKPDPEPYLLSFQQLGVPPQEGIVVEDATNGILSGKAAGAYVIAVLQSHGREIIATAHPDQIREDMRALPELLTTLR